MHFLVRYKRLEARNGERAVFKNTLIDSCKMNDIDPQSRMAGVLARMPDIVSRVPELIP